MSKFVPPTPRFLRVIRCCCVQKCVFPMASRTMFFGLRNGNTTLVVIRGQGRSTCDTAPTHKHTSSGGTGSVIIIICIWMDRIVDVQPPSPHLVTSCLAHKYRITNFQVVHLSTLLLHRSIGVRFIHLPLYPTRTITHPLPAMAVFNPFYPNN